MVAKRGDAFYEHVARFVREYEGKDFGRALARASDVPLTTAQGWIVTARERGLLDPGVNVNADDYRCPRCGFTRAQHRKVPNKITDPRERCVWLLRERVAFLERKLNGNREDRTRSE